MHLARNTSHLATSAHSIHGARCGQLAGHNPTLFVLFIFLFFLALQPVGLAQQPNASEDEVKAAYLLNFAKLGQWPRYALPDGPAPLVIGVSGGDEDFLNVLRATVAGKSVGTHQVVVKSVRADADMKACHIVFFRSGKKRGQAGLSSLAPGGMLSVGEEDTFLQQGGMINLVKEHGSVRFEVNPDALDRSEIHFSSKILALAKAGTSTPQAAGPRAQEEGTRPVERKVNPEYPELAVRMNLKGTVQVEAVVRPDGTVSGVKIIGGHPVLAEVVVNAVLLWKYQPGPKETLELVKCTFGGQ